MKVSDLFFGGLLVAAFASAPSCSRKHEVSCDAVFTHLRELTPETMHEMLDSNKDATLANCKTMSVEERRCALAAKSIQAMQLCKQPD
jgi:hypothetical protein